MTTVAEALKTRISVREFTSQEVSESTVRALLDGARWSPSGGNLQPWKVIVVTGDARRAVTELAQGVLFANPEGEADEFPIYPANLWEPYRSRRYDLGEQLYALLGIPREDRSARLLRFTRNYEFFGAPVGVFFVIDRRMGHGQWAHLGMFMQSLALLATERGLGTCMQEAWGGIRKSLGRHFGLGEHDVVYCGMALGYADPQQAVNRLRSSRMEVGEFARFEGF